MEYVTIRCWTEVIPTTTGGSAVNWKNGLTEFWENKDKPPKPRKATPEEEIKQTAPAVFKRTKTSVTAQLPYLDIVTVNTRSMCVGNKLKSVNKKSSLLKCFENFKPEFKNQNKVLMLSDTKANAADLKEFFWKDAGSIAGPAPKTVITAGGAAIIMVNSHPKRPHIFSEHSRNKNIAVATCQSNEGGKEKVMLISFYIPPT